MTETKVVIGSKKFPVRFSYANVFEPRAAAEGQDPKYSVSILINKDDEQSLDKIEAAVNAAKELGKSSKFNGKIPPNLKTPLRDGDTERDDEVYAGHYFINANGNQKPGIVDDALVPIMDRDEFYSGCYGRASVTFYAFNKNGNRGIACGLNNLQKLEDGDRLGGGSSAEDDFADDDFADDELM